MFLHEARAVIRLLLEVAAELLVLLAVLLVQGVGHLYTSNSSHKSSYPP